MTVTLTDRYIDAVTRTVPEKQRDDVARELRASIADQVEALLEGGEPADAAQRAVLTGLGDPDRLAAGYADRPLHLIGPRYFLEWKRLLILLLWIVPACAAFGVALGQVISGAPVGTVIAQTVVVVMQVILNVCFWVTLVFAVLERTTGATGAPLVAWSIDSLPEPKETGARLGDLIGTLIVLVAVAGYIVWDLTLGSIVRLQGSLSLLNPALWPGVIVPLFVVMALEIALAVWVYRTGRWTLPAAILNTVLAVAAAGILLANLGRLLNPAAVDLAVSSGASVGVGTVVTTVLGFVIAGIAVWDILDGFLKARQAR